jgi:ferredoxin-type protein NapF
MVAAMSRKDFLRGRFRYSAELIRPPYALPEDLFLEICEQCHDCTKHCPTDVIGTDSDGFPYLRFGLEACTFCGRCEEVCPTGALDQANARPWTVKAHISATCLSFNGIVCRACEEACEEEAITFKIMTGGRCVPITKSDRCTGCGSCAAICPTDSVTMIQTQLKETTA